MYLASIYFLFNHKAIFLLLSSSTKLLSLLHSLVQDPRGPAPSTRTHGITRHLLVNPKRRQERMEIEDFDFAEMMAKIEENRIASLLHLELEQRRRKAFVDRH